MLGGGGGFLDPVEKWIVLVQLAFGHAGAPLSRVHGEAIHDGGSGHHRREIGWEIRSVSVRFEVGIGAARTGDGQDAAGRAVVPLDAERGGGGPLSCAEEAFRTDQAIR